MSVHGFGERLGENVLDPDVERECERALVGLGAPSQLLVDRLLDAGEAAIVHVRETDGVCEEAALGIEALFLALQPETGNTEPVDGVRLLRRQVVPQQRGLSAGRDERGRALQVEIGEHATQRGEGLLAIEDLAGLHVKRVGRQVGGQENTVAVHDVRSPGRIEGGHSTGARRADWGADHRHIEGAHDQRTEAEKEDHSGGQQAAARALQKRRRRRLRRTRRQRRAIAAPPAPYRQVPHRSTSAPIGMTNAEGPAARPGNQRTCEGCTCSSGR